MTLAPVIALAAVLLAGSCQHRDPTQPGPGDPPPTEQPPFPGEPDTGAPAPAPTSDAGLDPVALQLCLETFRLLNPERTDAEILSIFCASPTDLAPFIKQAILNAHPRALAR